MLAPSSPNATPAGSLPLTRGQVWWRRFCRFAVSVFYRRCEVTGIEHLPASGPLLVCANHVNALADAVVLQANCPRPLHPLARSGLFRSPLLRPILRLIQAVPIYRRNPHADTAGRNESSFARCFEYLGKGRALLIFPEGQSHSDPSLRPLKTGAARLALGSFRRTGVLPAVVPAGLTFTHKGRFRGDVLISFGPPVPLPVPPPQAAEAAVDDEERATVGAYTDAITSGLHGVTLNVDDWEDVALMREVQSFARFRRGRRPTLSQRYQAFRRLAETHRWLRLTHPGEVRLLRAKLRRFARLRKRYGVQDYHLSLRYRPAMVARFVGWALVYALLVFPLALWGLLNAALPYLTTRQLSRWSARGRDQYDTASMLFGLLAFLGFWSAQTAAVAWRFGLWPAAALYAASLPLTAALALKVGYERRRILENVRVFFLFTRKREVQDYLKMKREEIEVELARLARVARSGTANDDAGAHSR